MKKSNKGRKLYAQETHEYELRLPGGRKVLATTRAVSVGQAWSNFLWRHNHRNEIPEIKIDSDRMDFDIVVVEEPPPPTELSF